VSKSEFKRTRKYYLQFDKKDNSYYWVDVDNDTISWSYNTVKSAVQDFDNGDVRWD